MYLKQVTLKNFRKFEELTQSFTQGKNEIKATNEWGKSTLADAIFFVLFGKLYDGRADFTTLKPTRNPSATVSAELVFVLANGAYTTLKKEYAEDWKAERGNDEKTFRGHLTNYYINGVQKKTGKDFDNEVMALFQTAGKLKDTKELAMITSPYYFAQSMTPKERLEFITKIIGEVSAREIIQSNTLLQVIELDLSNRANDDSALETYYRDNIKATAKTMEGLESQIKALQPTEPITAEQEETAKAKRQNVLKALTEIERLKNGDDNQTLAKLRADKTTALENLRTSEANDRKGVNERNGKVIAEVKALEAEQMALYNESIKQRGIITQLQAFTINPNTTKITVLKGEANALAEQYKAVNLRVYKAEPIKCLHCGHESLQSEADFNNRNAEDKKRLKAEYDNKAQTIQLLKSAIETAQKDIATAQAKIEELEPQLTTLETAIATKRLEFGTVVESEATKGFKTILEEIEQGIQAEIGKGFNQTAYEQEKARLNTELQSAQAIITSAQTNRQNLAQAIEHGKVMETHAKAKALLERKQMALAEYRQRKLAILEKRAEQVFPGIKFQFLKKNVGDDNMSQVCNILVQNDTNGLVEFPNANTATRIKVGVKLCGLIAKAIQAEQPFIVIDNAEAIVESNRQFGAEQVILLTAYEEAKQEEVQREQPHIEIIEHQIVADGEQITLFDIGGDK